MKTTSHSLMAKGIMVLLSLLILVFIFTYSWFIPPDYPATASGLSFSTTADIQFHIALGFETVDTGHYVISEFADSFDFTRIKVYESFTIGEGANEVTIDNGINGTNGEGDNKYNEYNLLKAFSPKDLTGNGSTLVRPFMRFKNKGIDTSKTSVESVFDNNVEYISFDIITCSSTPNYNISLADGSYVISAAEAYPGRVDSGDSQVDASDSSSLTYAINNGIERLTQTDTSLLNTDTQEHPLVRASSYGISSDENNSLPGFSEDSVVGAVRIAFTKYQAHAQNESDYSVDEFFGKATGVNSRNLLASAVFTDSSQNPTTPDLLWIPRNDIYLQNQYNQSDGEEKTTDWVLYDKDSSIWNSSNAADKVKDTQDFYDYNANSKTPSQELINLQRGMTYKDAASEHIYYNKNRITNVNIPSRYTFLVNDADLANTLSAQNQDMDYQYARYLVTGTDLENNKTAPDVSNGYKGENIVIDNIFSYGGNHYGKCHVNLWIEGCDAEARRAVDGGLFFFGFNFSATV